MSSQRAVQLIDAGHWLQMCGDREGARRLYEQALKLDPANVRGRQLLDSVEPAPRPSPPARMPAPVDEIPIVTSTLDDADWGEGLVVVSDDLDPVAPGELPDPEISWETVAQPQGTNAWESNSPPGVHINALKPGVGDAMDLISDTASEGGQPSCTRDDVSRKEEVQVLLRGAKDLLELDDHSGAMDLILHARELAPEDTDVERMRVRSEGTLQTMFESRLGEMTARPRVLLNDDDIIWLNLDHRAGFVLAQIDGSVSFEDLFEVCGMSRLDTARILAQLVDEGVITGRG